MEYHSNNTGFPAAPPASPPTLAARWHTAELALGRAIGAEPGSSSPLALVIGLLLLCPLCTTLAVARATLGRGWGVFSAPSRKSAARYNAVVGVD